MTALANEGARVLEEGYATRASDIDAVYCYGFGYPRHVGGPMFYADTVGLPTVLARVNEYRDAVRRLLEAGGAAREAGGRRQGFHGVTAILLISPDEEPLQTSTERS